MRHDLIYRRDTDGTPTVGVKITNRAARAWLNRADYDALLLSRGTSPWFAHARGGGHEYVSMTAPTRGCPVTVARLIMNAPKGTSITYLDRDPRNLRRSNLIAVRGLAPNAAHLSKSPKENHGR